MKILQWNLSRLKTKSRVMTGPLPDLYLRELTRLVEEAQGVYLSGIQVGDARRYAIPNPRFKDFPILYNPEIVEQYDLIKSEGEGCLSFPGMWVQVPRYKYITIRYRDGQWKEHTATFGSDDANTEAGLLAKAIQHEIFHMDGVVTHERIQDIKARIKCQAEILKQSLVQNRTKGIPELKEGPLELDPANLPVLVLPEAGGLVVEIPEEPCKVNHEQEESTLQSASAELGIGLPGMAEPAGEMTNGVVIPGVSNGSTEATGTEG
jgi:peptide deformylase